MKKFLLKIKKTFFSPLPEWLINDLSTLVLIFLVGLTLSIIFVTPIVLFV